MADKYVDFGAANDGDGTGNCDEDLPPMFLEASSQVIFLQRSSPKTLCSLCPVRHPMNRKEAIILSRCSGYFSYSCFTLSGSRNH